MSVRALILTGFGINCDAETEYAFRRAGAETQRVHMNDLAADAALLQSFHIFAVPGGFSFGDDVASGRILANRLRYKLGDPLKQFIRDGKLAIGICNGFQVLVKMGILPMFDGEFRQEVTLTHNDSARFEDRWVTMNAEPGHNCVWVQGVDRIELPVRHGEGKFIPMNDAVLQRMNDGRQIVLRYCRPNGAPANGEYPYNPNGSTGDIAAISDPTGRIFGLMPHPEAYTQRTNHPRWTREDIPEEGAGLQLFRNAVEYAGKNL